MSPGGVPWRLALATRPGSCGSSEGRGLGEAEVVAAAALLVARAGGGGCSARALTLAVPTAPPRPQQPRNSDKASATIAATRCA